MFIRKLRFFGLNAGLFTFYQGELFCIFANYFSHIIKKFVPRRATTFSANKLTPLDFLRRGFFLFEKN